jgi:hypothetical protein
VSWHRRGHLNPAIVSFPFGARPGAFWGKKLSSGRKKVKKARLEAFEKVSVVVAREKAPRARQARILIGKPPIAVRRPAVGTAVDYLQLNW